MMDLERLRAMWAAETPVKLAAAQATGSVGWLEQSDGTVREVVSLTSTEAYAMPELAP